MSLPWKVIILIILAIVSLLLNYQKISDGLFGIFPKTENIGVAFLSLSKKADQKFFQEDKTWGWPFAYWENHQFNLKSLIFDLIFCFAVWLVILFVIWFIGGIKRLQERRLKPPKFNF